MQGPSPCVGMSTTPLLHSQRQQPQRRHSRLERCSCLHWLPITLLITMLAAESFSVVSAAPKSPKPLPKWKRPRPPHPLPKWKRRPPPPDESRYASWQSEGSQEESSGDVLTPPSPIASPPPPTPPQPSNPSQPSPPRPNYPIMDIWVQAGGSNTWGDNGSWDADRVSDPPCTQERPGLIKMWRWGDQTWTDAYRNVHSIGRNNGTYSSTVGPDIPFARALLDLGLSERVGFVPCALGGTNMFWSWNPSSRDQYALMVNQTRAAMQSIGKRGRLAGMIMMLGEGDAMLIYNSASSYNPSGTVWSVYFGQLMQAMIERFRSDMSEFNQNLPVIIALQAVSGRQRVFPWIQSIRNQTEALNMPNLMKADMEGCRIYKVDLSALNGWLGIDPSVGWQGIHLSRVGQCCMGQRMAVAYARNLPYLVNQQFNPRMPSILPDKDKELITQYDSWPQGPAEPPSPPPGGLVVTTSAVPVDSPPPPRPPLPPPPLPPNAPFTPFAPWMSGVFNFPLANHAALDMSTADSVTTDSMEAGEGKAPQVNDNIPVR